MHGAVPPGLVPWHLWGSSKSVQFKIGSLGNIPLNVGQLARIRYGRPDAWRFLFGLTIDGGDQSKDGTVTLVADFSVLAGIGRSALLMPSFQNPSSPGFCQFVVSDTIANLVGRTLWTSKVRAPENLNSTGGGTWQPDFDVIPAEEIQCGCIVGAAAGVTAAAGTLLNVTAHAYFAPNVHIRPDWFSGPNEQRYVGGETGGQ